MRVLVCGGAGYIGSHMVKMLLDCGHDAVTFDNLSSGHRDAVTGGRFELGDLGNRADLARVFRAARYDVVMQFAACIRVDKSVHDPGKYFRNNTANTLNLLDAMVEHRVPLVFSSTASVYGEPRYVPMDEAHPAEPMNAYGASKRMIEEMLRYYTHAYGLRAVALRYFNAAGVDPEGRLGPRHRPLTHLIPIVLRAARGALPEVCVYGRDYDTPDGTCVRDYIHVLDLCDGHLRALDYLLAGGPTTAFNLGTGTGRSVQEVIHAARRIPGCSFPVRTEGRRPGDPATLIADPRRAMRELNWQPQWSDLDTILCHSWRWEQRVAPMPVMA